MPFRSENDRIPVVASGVLLVSSIAELNFVLGPRVTVAAAGTAAWIAVIPAALLVALSVWIACRLIQAFPGHDLTEIAAQVLGRPAALALTGVYIVYWLLRAGQLVQVQTYVFGITLIEETPRSIIAAYMVLLSTYLAAHGIEPLARVALLIFPAHLPLVAITVAALFTGDFGRLLPHGLLEPDAVAAGTWAVFSNAPGVEILLMIAPFLAGKGSVLKSALSGIAALTVLAISLQIALLVNFGVADTHQFLMPTLELSRVARVPGFEGLRLDPVFVVMWFSVTFTALATVHYMALAAVRSVFRAERSRWPIIGTSIAIGVLGAYPISPPQLLDTVETWRQYVVPVMSLGIPLVLLLAALGRGASLRARV